MAYQNADGGFGNGIELDLSCPGSSAIGAETALYVLDLLDDPDSDIILPLFDWLEAHQTDSGAIQHPPPDLAQYPHQPWWVGDDSDRALVLAAYLKEWQTQRPTFFKKVRRLYEQTPPPEPLSFYSYPYLTYLATFQQTADETAQLDSALTQLPTLLTENADHFPLFGRYWYHLNDYVDSAILEQAASTVAEAFEQQGHLPNPYPNLPGWTPIFNLDALILLKKGGYL